MVLHGRQVKYQQLETGQQRDFQSFGQIVSNSIRFLPWKSSVVNAWLLASGTYEQRMLNLQLSFPIGIIQMGY